MDWNDAEKQVEQMFAEHGDDYVDVEEFLVENDVGVLECLCRARKFRVGELANRIAELTAERDRLDEELQLWRPMTNEEAEKALDEAVAVPMSDEEIARIVERATDPANMIPESDQIRMAAKIRQLTVERDRLKEAISQQNYAIEQTLGRALGYPRYADDQQNFPGATGDDVCVGEHVAESLASEAARRIAELESERDRLRGRVAELSAEQVHLLVERFEAEGEASALRCRVAELEADSGDVEEFSGPPAPHAPAQSAGHAPSESP